MSGVSFSVGEFSARDWSPLNHSAVHAFLRLFSCRDLPATRGPQPQEEQRIRLSESRLVLIMNARSPEAGYGRAWATIPAKIFEFELFDVSFFGSQNFGA